MSKLQTVRVLSCDPGVVNSAVFVADLKLDAQGVIKGIKVIASFMMTTTIHDHTTEARNAFVKYVKQLKRKYKPQIFICERFQPRGGFLKASIVECVNWMIALMSIIFDAETKLVTAASWKNVYTKRGKVNLKDLYKKHKKYLGPHRTDAILMMIIQFGFESAKAEKFIQYVVNNLIKNEK